jgi:hypothetical protein
MLEFLVVVLGSGRDSSYGNPIQTTSPRNYLVVSVGRTVLP